MYEDRMMKSHPSTYVVCSQTTHGKPSAQIPTYDILSIFTYIFQGRRIPYHFSNENYVFIRAVFYAFYITRQSFFPEFNALNNVCKE